MPHRFTFLLILINIFLLSSNAFAQQPIRGKIVDSLSNEIIAGASVSLFNQKDSLITSTSTSISGQFLLKALPEASYILQINAMGYKRYRMILDRQSLSIAKVIAIPLSVDNTLLADVNIAAPPPMVVLKGDTIEFNASSFTTEPYADSDALIAQLPGVEIDEEGNLKSDGDDVQRIMVDGKEFFSSDPRIAMKTLPADIIDKIQIIDEKSDQAKFTGFDDGERKKIMNIVTKVDRRNGYFGKVAGGYGNMERYNTGSSVNAFDGNKRLSLNLVSNNVNQQNFSMEDVAGGSTTRTRGRGGNRGGGGGSGLRATNNFAANYNNEWWDKLKANGNYTFNNTNSSTISLLNREYLIGKRNNQLSAQNQNNKGENSSHRANFKLEYELDSNNSIIFSPNIQYQKVSSISHSNNLTTFDTKEPINSSVREQESSRSNINFSGNFTYRRKLNTKGRTLSLAVNGSANSNNGLAHNLSLNEFYTDFLLNRVDTTNNKNNSNANGNGFTSRLAYTEPISKSSRLQANYSLRNTNSYSNRETFEFLAETGQLGELNTRLSNEFKNDYMYHSGGLGFLFSMEKIRFDVGLDFQQAHSKSVRVFPIEANTNSQFTSYLPNAGFTYRISKQKSLQFNYNTATKAPNINQLQDVVNNQNTLNIRTGNADLKQEYGHRFSLRYKAANREKGVNFSANANADFANNKIVNSTFLASQDTLIDAGVLLGKGGRFTRPENVNGYYNFRGNTTLGIPLKKLKMNINLNVGAFYTRDIGLLNNELSSSSSSGINQRIAINSKISQKVIVSFTYSGNYSNVENSLNPELSYDFYRQNIKNDFTFLFWKGIRTSSTLNYHYNTGLTNNDSQSFILWNASIGKKLFKRQNGEITLTAYDIFNNNTSLTRNISDQYIEDRESNILNQYFILGFTYNLRKFGGKSSGVGRSDRGMRMLN